ncbi:MAG: GTP 3',8-cyclase MoaA [Candidatus Obscuribacter sp.]|jgi:cyclic pyranopterin phosphate synthase|nr:GTP 3',8-cyclase MoaA [Candidatus Obscuribacter sp.]MBK7839680.1 GTP 3',8-cyclase MoaA [Candidatus Obscuribacter sp.]MBK9202384.1 GTP 3',8-cyclase MoaA [Candidatus Obscuribacter sp.]MBK9618827.1 GTP 3',8-cyclase MoaA [Candidatus Obscuribacter sp.]MBL0184339.1 GTP 3',8-cyclase MoaA [Candidatus Obscuribacter sp.]
MNIPNKLIDSFGREHTYLRIAVTDRCNLRCNYCLPLKGVVWKNRTELLSNDEILRLARLFVSVGITKIRLTGGEPMVRSDLPELVRKLSGLAGLQTLAMTTNATLLTEHAAALKASGLQCINISLDTFKRERFAAITGSDQLEIVMAGIARAIACQFDSIKLNVVVMAGVNDDEVIEFVDFAHKHDINVRFIEYMPFKDNNWSNASVVTYKDLKARIEGKYLLSPVQAKTGDVAKDFNIEGAGQVGFITSMSESFCDTCNRLRLTAEGTIKTCLFYPAETNLRDAMREGASDENIRNMIGQALTSKPKAHPPAEEIATSENRAMIEIGG